jgi:hypothetical protein
VFGFVFTTMTVNYAFSGRDRRLLLIDAGNWLIVLLVMVRRSGSSACSGGPAVWRSGHRPCR